LLVSTWGELSTGIGPIAIVFLRGAFYDLVSITYFIVPFALYLGFLPERVFLTRAHRVLSYVALFVVLYLIAFGSVAEWFFWAEFSVRPNFIAVDYLIYTNEVIANIRESYPLGIILPALALVVIFFARLWIRSGLYREYQESKSNWSVRIPLAAALLFPAAASWLFVDSQTWPRSENVYNAELGSNGAYSFGEAFWSNELPYLDFYPHMDSAAAWQRARKAIGSEVNAEPHCIDHQVAAHAPRKNYNIVLLTIESLSAKYMGLFGNPDGLTTNLDALARESMVFERCLATGTRTVRGMEALTLSVPPTPGRSIVKRKNNHDLGTIASVLGPLGYDSVFLYGGNGYFDNMNEYFGGNGFRVVDKESKPKSQISFSNAWGACDEDLYGWCLEEADRAFAQKKPFFHFVMSVSNHRPYTFPSGTIDAPQGRRSSAVQYTDYAIGRFLEQARTREWFDHTIFAIVADHCASSAGRMSLPIEKYHIPLLIYAPRILMAGTDCQLSSQIDVGPTLLGMIGLDYVSHFYGRDLLAGEPSTERKAFVGTYQKLGYVTPTLMTVLRPRSESEAFGIDVDALTQVTRELDAEHCFDAISFYQTAFESLRARDDRPQ
jgi:phosphoglycerol transferase MdoB-like AlkP superfamily enzyme